MIGLSLESVKASILEQEKILDSAERASLRALARFGAFVRQRAKTSIRPRDKISEPGKPPSSHVGLLRDRILFEVERAAKNVVIGPMLLRGTTSPDALAALEHGGQSLIMDRGQAKSALIQARPFMQPAFDIELEKAPYLWENSLR